VQSNLATPKSRECPGHDEAAAPNACDQTLEALTDALARETNDRRRAECMAHIQSEALRLAIDVLVREPDITGFFRTFIRTIVEESESHGCGVWLLDGESSSCDLWMAQIQERFFLGSAPEWAAMSIPREAMASHLLAYRPGWTDTTEYAGDDARLPETVREYNRASGVQTLVIAPLVLPTRNLGWVALSCGDGPGCETAWRRALLEAMARQATLALHQSQLAEQSRIEERRQAVLEERNRMARDIHDTLAQGFGAILMQLQAAQRSAALLPATVQKNLDTATELARTHLIDARRSVSALRPQTAESENVASALQRITELVQRTTDVPITLTVGELPPLGGGVNREIIGIAQEALTNAVRHSRARQISVQASAVRSLGFRLSVADDGRGIAKENRGAGFGMTSMQERAERIGASLTIVTAPRLGTEVVLAWEPPSFNIPNAGNAAR
jgi:signal transduction histidine kinase